MEVLREAITDFCRRKKGQPFCPTAVIRQMFPEDWELFRQEIIDVTMQMHQENLLDVSVKEGSTGGPEEAGVKILILGLRKLK